MSIFKEESGKWSSKRVVGIIGIICTMLFVYLEKGSDTLILGLVAAYTALLGVGTFKKTGGQIPPDDDEGKK